MLVGIMDVFALSIFAIVVLVYSYREGLGYLSEPGAGFFGFIVGIILLVTSIFLAISYPRKPQAKSHDKTAFFSLFKTIGAMILYALLLERSGLLVTTFITGLILFARRDFIKTLRWFLITGITTLGVYFIFVVLLKCIFPEGILERILFKRILFK